MQSADRALAILVAFGEDRPELGVSELASELGLHKSTVSRLLAALAARGLVARAGERFVPGHELARLGALVAPGPALVHALGDTLERLAEETGETVNVAVRRGALALNVHQVESTHLVGVRDWTGRAFPLHATANGKALLAFGGGPRPRELPALTARTITDAATLGRELARARARGYAVAVEELELGLHAVAAPVFDRGGACVAAISISAPAYRLPRRRLAAAGGACAAAAAEASARLGRGRAA